MPSGNAGLNDEIPLGFFRATPFPRVRPPQTAIGRVFADGNHIFVGDEVTSLKLKT
jgi:hypothetical protein